MIKPWIHCSGSRGQKGPNGESIGDACEGGYFAGLISTAGNGVADYYLIVAPKATGETTKAWGPLATTTGITSVIDGPGNTAALAGLAGTYASADWCAALNTGAQTDWYLPAKNELEVLYFNLKPKVESNNIYSGSNANAVSPEPQSSNYSAGAPAQIGAALFQLGQSEAFVDGSYSTSTEGTTDAANAAWYQGFGNGAQSDSPGYENTSGKTVTRNVRAVRRVAI